MQLREDCWRGARGRTWLMKALAIILIKASSVLDGQVRDKEGQQRIRGKVIKYCILIVRRKLVGAHRHSIHTYNIWREKNKTSINLKEKLE